MDPTLHQYDSDFVLSGLEWERCPSGGLSDHISPGLQACTVRLHSTYLLRPTVYRVSFSPLQGMNADAFEKKFNTMEVDFIRSQQLFCRDVLKLNAGQRAVGQQQ